MSIRDLEAKTRIEVSTTISNKVELKKLAKREGLTLSTYLVLKGLGRLKENK